MTPPARAAGAPSGLAQAALAAQGPADRGHAPITVLRAHNPYGKG